jgi:hypothetical protein
MKRRRIKSNEKQFFSSKTEKQCHNLASLMVNDGSRYHISFDAERTGVADIKKYCGVSYFYVLFWTFHFFYTLKTFGLLLQFCFSRLF